MIKEKELFTSGIESRFPLIKTFFDLNVDFYLRLFEMINTYGNDIWMISNGYFIATDIFR